MSFIMIIFNYNKLIIAVTLKNTDMNNFKITNQEEKDECLMWISDLYKDVNGFRPRGYNFDEWSFQELTKFVNDLSDQADQEREYHREQAQLAEVEFNERIQEVIDLGAGDRETALRWMLQGDMGDDESLDLYAVEYFTMIRGIDTTETGRKVERELINIANTYPEAFGIAA